MANLFIFFPVYLALLFKDMVKGYGLKTVWYVKILKQRIFLLKIILWVYQKFCKKAAINLKLNAAKE